MKKSIYIASGIIISASIWMWSGAIASDKSLNTDKIKIEKNNIIKVKAKKNTAQEHVVKINVTGMTKSSKNTIIRSEIDGKITEIIFEEGDIVEKGDILAIIEDNDRKTRLEYTKKLFKQKNIEYMAAKSLETKGYNSKIKLAIAETNLEEAKNLLKQAKDNVEKLRIHAPYTGVINRQMIEEGEFIANNHELYEIIDINMMEITAYLSEHEIIKLGNNIEAEAKLVNGKSYKGKITYISPKADESNRTFRIIMSVNNKEHKILSGMSAQIVIPVENKKLHEISPSSLSLSDSGSLGVKIVNKDNIVEFIAINIISENKGMMLIDGLEDEVNLITVGQEFIKSGALVEPVFASDNE